MSKDHIGAELPESKSKYVYVRGYYVRPHYRRRPRRQPAFPLDPITEKEVCKQFMLAMLHERRQDQQRRDCELKKKYPSLFRVLGTSRYASAISSR